jgi:hypothetical protein
MLNVTGRLTATRDPVDLLRVRRPEPVRRSLSRKAWRHDGAACDRRWCGPASIDGVTAIRRNAVAPIRSDIYEVAA